MLYDNEPVDGWILTVCYTYPNKWLVKHAKDADLFIHECFIAVPDE